MSKESAVAPLIAPPAPDPGERPKSGDNRREQRMNGRDQIAEAHTKLNVAITNITQTYIDVGEELGLDEDTDVAMALSDLVSASERCIDKMEAQLNRDLINDQLSDD
jgi:hypothetical protein